MALVLAAVTGLAGCGLESGGAVPLDVGPGSITPIAELSGVEITVGSKDFSESIVLGYIAEFALSAAGADVRDLTNIQGSNSARAALENDQIDLYWEYTGTAYLNYQGNTEPIQESQALFESVRDTDARENGIAWTALAPLDNTYALAISPANAERLGVETLSDYAELIRTDPEAATTCLETEFASRADGFNGMAEAYGFDAARAPTQILATGAIYSATATSQPCVFGEVFRTDGRIVGLDLQVLEDDLSFFPRYNAAVNLRSSVNAAYPQISEVLTPISALLTTETISGLNAQVDVEGREPAEVARDWLVQEGFVSLP